MESKLIYEVLKLSLEAKAMAAAMVKTLNKEQLDVFNKHYKDCLIAEVHSAADEFGLNASLKDLLDKQ